MTFLGVGSFASKYIVNDLLRRFIIIEIAVGIIGGVSVLLLYPSFARGEELYYTTAFLLTATISFLAGLEIPLVTRILKDYQGIKDALAHILCFDYLGALIASILFPVVLLPTFGMLRTAFFVGILNLLAALVLSWEFRIQLGGAKKLIALCIGSLCVISYGLWISPTLVGIAEQALYDDEIVLSSQSQYQKITVTQYKDDTRLYLNGNLQFSSYDEYRYHEPLVHIPMAVARNVERVLILGGGDGLAVRELLHYATLKEIVLVDLDPAMTSLATTHPLFTRINNGALTNNLVQIIHDDAWKFLERGSDLFDLIIIDLPDPSEPALGKLYTKEFYTLVAKRLSATGVMVTQASSPYFAREAFWCIEHTIHAVFSATLPYKSYVPSFGEWGFVLAAERSLQPPVRLLYQDTRYLTEQNLHGFFVFDRDTEAEEGDAIPVNTLDTQELLKLYARGWVGVG